MSKDFAELVGTCANRVSTNGLSTQPAYDISPESRNSILERLGKGKSWASNGEDFIPIGTSHQILPSALYTCQISTSGPYLKKMENNTDSMIDLPDSESEKLLAEVVKFQGLSEAFKKHGFLYKRGILLWGPPGSGKTVTIQQLIKLFVTDAKGIAIMIGHPEISAQCMHVARNIEPERQILAIIEDLDALIQMHGESGYLNLLDGESQLQNVCYVATTNYPERLDKRFVDRPSRFDTIRYIGMPSAAARHAYIKSKILDWNDDQIDYVVQDTDGFSIAYLREFIVLSQCFGLSVTESLERLRKMHKRQPSSTDNGSSFGFA